jgi:hypothetical protein
MRKVLLGTLAAGLLALGVPAASAHDNDAVKWSCNVVREPIGIFNSGPYFLAGVAATAEAGGGTFWCEIRVNGVGVSNSIHTHGENVFVTAGPLRGYSTDETGFEVCGHITWDDGHTPLDSCTPTLGVPNDPVTDLLDTLNDLSKNLDPAICSVLMTLAPTVNGLGHPELIHIDEATGDLFLLGVVLTPPPGGDLFWDCPPYNS